jgi:hypothetical protein
LFFFFVFRGFVFFFRHEIFLHARISTARRTMLAKEAPVMDVHATKNHCNGLERLL